MAAALVAVRPLVDGECVSRAGKLGDFGHVFVAILMVRSVCHAAVVMPKTLR